MSGLWNAGGSSLDFTAGDFAGSGAFTVAVLTRPTFANHGMAEWFAGGVNQMAFLLFGGKLFGRSDTSAGFGAVPTDAWYVLAVSKAAGAAHYRMHAWPYAADGSGVMAHGESAGAADHGNFAAATSIRVGSADGIGGAGSTAVLAAWDRALSDAELDGLVSTSLSDWSALAPDFGVELSGWDGAAGAVVWAGSSVFSGENGVVAAGANPPTFDFAVLPPDPNNPPTVSAGLDQETVVGEPVSLTAVGVDTDGTVAGYLWTQTGGAAVVLAGGGASRTFTPASAGVRTFQVQAYDDDGDLSAPDSVTVITTAPVDPDAVLPPELWNPDPDDNPWKPPLDTPGLESWLRSKGLGAAVAVIDGPDIPPDPGTVLVVTWLQGAGLSTEGMLSSPGFQIRTIGPQGNRDAARELAERVDYELVLRFNAWPALIGGRYVVIVRRAGGEPAQDRFDAAGRAHYVCTYVADVEAQ